MTRLILIISLLCSQYPCYSQLITNKVIDSRQHEQRPKIGLALSGGAAHGLAHIGVLKYMEEVGIEVDYVTGTSMGAVVGAMYAIGYSAQQCAEVAASVDWNSILTNEISQDDVAPIEKYSHGKFPVNIDYRDGSLQIPEGILASNKLDLLLEEIYAPAYLTNDFSKFNIPFKCCAVDIVDGSIVELSQGRLSESVRASMAIPSVFSPVELEGRLLVDGGLIRNFPVANVKEMGADLVIGSYVGSDRGEAAQLGSLLDILKQSAFMMSISDSEEQAAMTDILLQPDVKEMPVFGFDNYQEFIDVGYKSAKAQAAKFEAIKQLQDAYPSNIQRPSLESPGFIYVDEVEVRDTSVTAQKVIRKQLKVKDRSYTTFSKINEGVQSIYATKNFSKVRYYLSPGDVGTRLVVEGDKLVTTRFGASINHFSSTRSSIVLGAEARNKFGSLSNLQLLLRVGEKPGLSASYYKRTTVLNNGLVLGIDTKMENLSLPMRWKGKQIKNFNYWQGNIKPYVQWESSKALSVRAYWKAEYQYLENKLELQNDLKSYVLDQYSIGIHMQYNTLKKPYFAKDGWKINLGVQYSYANSADITVTGENIIDAIGIPSTYLSPTLNIQHYVPLLPKWVLELRAAASYRKRGYFLDNTLIGGAYQDDENRQPFIGMTESELQLATYALGRLAIRCQLYNWMYISAVANVIGGNQPINDFLSSSPDSFISKIGAGISVGLDSPIGPVILDLGYIPNDELFTVHFSLGHRHIF